MAREAKWGQILSSNISDVKGNDFCILIENFYLSHNKFKAKEANEKKTDTSDRTWIF